MRVLGVDPGLTRCGFGVVDGTPGRRPVLVEVGVVRTPAADELGDRLVALGDAAAGWLARHEPDVVAVERVFAQHNVRTVMAVAQGSAMVLAAAARVGVPVVLHTPSEVKAAVTGSGRADKAMVTEAVTRLLALPERPTPADAADAIALALTHLWRGTGNARLAAAVAAQAAARPAAAASRTAATRAAATRAAATRAAATRVRAS